MVHITKKIGRAKVFVEDFFMVHMYPKHSGVVTTILHRCVWYNIRASMHVQILCTRFCFVIPLHIVN